MSDLPANATLMLGFDRGIAPAKWARRWAASMPDERLELLPLGQSSRRPGEPPVDRSTADVVLERIAPGETPSDATRRAIHLYEEAVALVVNADHELAGTGTIDVAELTLVTLLDYPGHSPVWPPARPWEDPSWRPRNERAALDLVAAGTGAILIPLPLARHLASRKDHAVLTVFGEPALTGSTVWASWAMDRDGPDVQQLVGILRGRTARSSRAPGATNGGTQNGAAAGATKPKPEPHSRSTSPAKKTSKTQPKPGSRGAQLAAARQKAERHAAEKRAAKKRKRR